MLSPLIPTVCGGTGVGTILTAVAGDSVGAGVHHGIIIAGILPDIGVAATGVDTGDGITIITTIQVMDGVEVTGEVVMDGDVQGIQITDLIDIPIQVLLIPVVLVDTLVVVQVAIILVIIQVAIRVVVEPILVVPLGQ
jgi:hypothetical protein